jgi:hypothetical protein
MVKTTTTMLLPCTEMMVSLIDYSGRIRPVVLSFYNDTRPGRAISDQAERFGSYWIGVEQLW